MILGRKRRKQKNERVDFYGSGVEELVEERVLEIGGSSKNGLFYLLVWVYVG